MKTVSLVLLMTLLSIGHSYAQVNLGENERAPHEREMLDTYTPILKGEKAITVDIPTDVYGETVNSGQVHDDFRFPGKILEGRAPAVLLDRELNADATKK